MLTAGQERELRVAWQPSGHARRLVTLALAGLAIAVLARRPEFAGLAAPAVLLLLPGRNGRPDAVAVTLAAALDRITEGDQAVIAVRIAGADGCDLRLRLHPAAWITAGPAAAGADGWHRLPVEVQRWGIRPVGTIELVLHDRWRLHRGSLLVAAPECRCYPQPARLGSLVVLSRLPARIGDHRARSAGEGIEFAGVREFVPGDRQRRINWPATTRRGTLQLNTFAAERAQAVVVLMDVSADIGVPGRTSSDLAVRAASGTALAYLSVRDRVGLISFGKGVRWVTPAAGKRQIDRIMDMILADSGDGQRLDAVSRLPHAALPPGALVIAFSPLLSLRLVEALRTLRERGFAVIVVDVLTAEPDARSGLATGLGWQMRLGISRRASSVRLARLVPGGRSGAAAGGLGMIDLARRVWQMEQDAIRFSLRELGVPVVRWDGQSSLDEPLAPYSRRALVNRA